MTPVEQMTCEELEAELDQLVRSGQCLYTSNYYRSLNLLAELKSRRLAQSAG